MTESRGNQPQTSEHDSSRKQTNSRKSYEAKVSSIIRKIRRLCLLPPMTTTDVADHVRDWTEVLQNVIPEPELEGCYLSAVQNPDRSAEDSKFPLRATELLYAWRKKQAALGPQNEYECDMCRWAREQPGSAPCPFHSTRGIQ